MTSLRRDLVFISYSHDDVTWLERVLKFLKPYTRQGLLTPWADKYIKEGNLWRRDIDSALERTSIALLLVSPDFLDSDFIMDEELPALLEAAQQGLLTVFAVPLSTVPVEVTPLHEYQWARSPEEPLDLLPEPQRNAALVEITRKLHAAVKDRADTVASLPAVAVLKERVPVAPLTAPAHGRSADLHGVPPLPPHYLPRAEDLARLKRALMQGTESAVGITAASYRLGLHGQGGIGKSVLAAALARDGEVRRACPDGIHWIAVGQEPDLLRLQETLASQAAPGEPFTARSVEEGRTALEKCFRDRSCLLVVDDVWDVRHARVFDVLGAGSRLLVTTRDGAVLTALGAHEEEIERLPQAAALELLARWANDPDAALSQTACEVARECGHLPLALSVAGARVRDGISWEDALAALREASLEFLDHPYGNVFRSMRLGIDALPDDERARYLELAVFPEEERVPESMILKLWEHTGELDAHQAKSLLVKLERKALLEMAEAGGTREIVLHDLQHDFLRILAEDLPRLHGRLLDALASTLPAADGPLRTWHALPADEPYPWVRLGEHLVAAGREEEFRALLLDYRWLEAKLRTTGVSAVLSDFAAFPHDRDLALVAGALRLSAHIVGRDADQLPSQLVGRLLSLEEPGIRSFVALIQPIPSRPWLRPLAPSLDPPTTGLLRTLAGHSDWVTSVALAADGRRAVSGSYDCTLKVWEVETGEEVRTLAGHADVVNAVAMTVDGRLAVSGSEDRTLKVWEVETGEVVRTLIGHAGGVTAVALTPDGRLAVSGSHDGTLKVWEIETGENVRTFRDARTVKAVALTGDGRRAVCGSDNGTLKVWEVETGELLHTLVGHTLGVNAMALTADGRQAVSCASDGTLKVWEVETGEAVRTLWAHEDWVNSVALTADGRQVVSGADNGTLTVWEVETGDELRTFSGHADWVRAVAVTADGRRAVSASDDGTLKVWELGPAEVVRTLRSPGNSVIDMALTADGRRAVSISDDGALRVWEVETGEEVRTIETHEDWVIAVALTPDGRQAASASDDGTLRMWEVKTGEEVHTLVTHADDVYTVAFTADVRRVAFGSDGTLTVREVETGKEVRTIVERTHEVNVVALTANGQRALSGLDDGTVIVWEVEQEAEGRTLKGGHTAAVLAVALTANGRWAVSGANDWTVKVWDVESGKEVHTLTSHTGPVKAVAVTADGQQAVSASEDGTVVMWDLSTGDRQTVFTADAPVFSCAVSADGHTIVAGDALGRVHFLRLEGSDTGGG